MTSDWTPRGDSPFRAEVPEDLSSPYRALLYRLWAKVDCLQSTAASGLSIKFRYRTSTYLHQEAVASLF